MPLPLAVAAVHCHWQWQTYSFRRMSQCRLCPPVALQARWCTMMGEYHCSPSPLLCISVVERRVVLGRRRRAARSICAERPRLVPGSPLRVLGSSSAGRSQFSYCAAASTLVRRVRGGGIPSLDLPIADYQAVMFVRETSPVYKPMHMVGCGACGRMRCMLSGVVILYEKTRPFTNRRNCQMRFGACDQMRCGAHCGQHPRA